MEKKVAVALILGLAEIGEDNRAFSERQMRIFCSKTHIHRRRSCIAVELADSLLLWQ
jgi:hypothetical protein